MQQIPKHAIDRSRGTIKLSDFRPSNLHPKAKLRISMALLGTFLLIFGCIYMLSTTTITLNPDPTTSAGISAIFRNCVAGGYVIGTILTIFILWHLMIKDCPISPAGKANYEATHDKSLKGVKIIAAMSTAIATKGSGSSIENVAKALDDYFDADEQIKQEELNTANPKVR